jgi:Cdc6-like AAA superfamily ATPase
MMELFKTAFGSDGVRHMRQLPLQQRVVLCAMYSLDADTVPVGKLEAEYLRICAAKCIQAAEGGFCKLLTLMDCSGLVDLVGRRGKNEVRDVSTYISFLYLAPV